MKNKNVYLCEPVCVLCWKRKGEDTGAGQGIVGLKVGEQLGKDSPAAQGGLSLPGSQPTLTPLLNLPPEVGSLGLLPPVQRRPSWKSLFIFVSPLTYTVALSELNTTHHHQHSITTSAHISQTRKKMKKRGWHRCRRRWACHFLPLTRGLILISEEESETESRWAGDCCWCCCWCCSCCCGTGEAVLALVSLVSTCRVLSAGDLALGGFPLALTGVCERLLSACLSTCSDGHGDEDWEATLCLSSASACRREKDIKRRTNSKTRTQNNSETVSN